MRIKLIKQPNIKYNPIEQVLYNRNIEEKDFKKYIDFKYLFYNYNLLSNIDKAVNCLIKHIENKSVIVCIVDSDCDGITATASLIGYLNKNFPEIKVKYIMHPGKEHGIIINEIPEDCQLLISPDGGSENIQQHLELHNRGIDVIVLDHHEYDPNIDTPAIIVNSMNNYPNNQLCGAGVVYKFLEGLDKMLGISDSENYIDLCALGLIGDMMSMTSLETLSLINKGLININNEFLKALIEKQSYPMKGEITPISIAFYIVPLINATIRSGTQEEKQVVFEAFLNPNKELESTKRGDKGNIELAKDQAIRYMTNCKSRQDKEVEKYKEKIEILIEEENLLKNKILIIPINFEINKNIVGLIANQIAAKYSRPTLILRKSERGFSGSGRNARYSEIVDLKSSLCEVIKDQNLEPKVYKDEIEPSTDEVSDFIAGHANAFGIGISTDKLENFIDATNKIFENITYEDVLLVDFNFNGKCKSGIIQELNKYKYLYGQQMSEPNIAVYNLTVNNRNCSIMGKTNDTIKIVDENNICYMLFKQKQENVEIFRDKLRNGDFLIATLI